MINSIATVNHLLSSRTRHAYADTGMPPQKHAEKSTTPEAGTVRISAQGKLAAKMDMDSLNSYRVPDWIVDFVPQQSILNSEAMDETRAHLNMLETMSADGQLSAAEKQLMTDQLANHSPATQKMHASAAFLTKFEDELNEYSGILSQAYDQAKRENGITSRDDYIVEVLNTPDDNLALRDSVAGKLLDNPRALELMDMLGIARPSVA
jgi:hypothetical protein